MLIHSTFRRIIFSNFLVIIMLIIQNCNGSDQIYDPWQNVVKKPPRTPHEFLFKGQTFSDGPSVTRACLKCHDQAATEVMSTSHWTWLGEPEMRPGRTKSVRLGKKNLINNFCIGIEGNWPKCTKCHAGYGWMDASFDFSNADNIDCLVCHDLSGLYDKAAGGSVSDGVDLLASAKSVGRPTRDNCGYCHFNGGGGDAVKHGDLDGSLSKPVERIDVHMGRYNFQCIDCHKTLKHNILGKAISVSSHVERIACSDCHSEKPHQNFRLNDHTNSLACQTCHIPRMAVRRETKIAWDWSTAGQDIAVDEPHKYLKMKGSFIYARNVNPEYYWFNGSIQRYVKGDIINPTKVTHLNHPLGDITDIDSRIWPFKVHRAKQPYDEEYKYLIIPKTVGKGGYWSDFDWDQAARLGSKASGLEYSGKLGFTETDMHWSLSHMITPAEYALRCIDCHGDRGVRMNWHALGYDGDPALVGGRQYRRTVRNNQGTQE